MGLGGGIIPARAGFTFGAFRLGFCVPDHPRSRGVYEADGGGVHFRSGSSPLARGLHLSLSIFYLFYRIIPARAGFTAIPSPRDFPHGSSPLARGLRLRPAASDVTLRIIPARAGFTDLSQAVGPLRTDHPRSRGVYSTTFTPASTVRGSSPLARGLPESNF